MEVRLIQEQPVEPRKGRDSFADHYPGPWWAVTDMNDWTFSVHLAEKDDTIVVGEIRVKPAEAVESPDPTLRYEPDSIPGRGISATLIHDFNFGRLIKAGIHQFTTPPDSNEGIDHLHWAEGLKSGGFDSAKVDSYTRKQRRGRPPLPEEELARVAYYYAEAISQQVKALHAYVSLKLYDTNEFAELVRQRVDKCRKRGFLTEAPAKGIAGGHLTPKAIEVINRLALENRQEKGDGE